MLRILHVDGDEVASLTRAALGDEVEVDSVATTAEAEQRLVEEPYDLAVVGSVDAIVALRGYGVPIVAVVWDGDMARRAAQAGAIDFVKIPIETRELAARLVFAHECVVEGTARPMGRTTVGRRIQPSVFEQLKPFIACDSHHPFVAA